MAKADVKRHLVEFLTIEVRAFPATLGAAMNTAKAIESSFWTVGNFTEATA